MHCLFETGLGDHGWADLGRMLLSGDGQYGQDVTMRERSSFHVFWTANVALQAA
jgi:hypothetical protein